MRSLDSPLELGWLAGILEGEGTFGVFTQAGRARAQVAIQLSSTDYDVILRAACLFGTNMNGPYKPSCSNFVGHKMRYCTRVHGRKAQEIAAQLYTQMGERRQEQIRKMLASPQACGRSNHFHPVTRQLVSCDCFNEFAVAV